MIAMILQMTAATLLYVIATAILWRFWNRVPEHKIGIRLAVGVFYGLCSIASNHIGINYGSMVLNVRDIGPLAAGLFFDPVAGLVSGLIGGVERFLIGEFFGIGSFTRVACGLSTFLAGVLSAVLNRWIYMGRRPTVTHSFSLGAVMEVFHMYTVLLTHRDQMSMAYMVVQTCSIPMILFTGLGLAGCSACVLRLSGFKGAVNLWTPQRETPIYIRFQRWLLIVTIGLFSLSSFLTFSFQQQMAFQNATASLQYERDDYQNRIAGQETVENLLDHPDEFFISSNALYYVIDADASSIVGGFTIDEPVPLSGEELDSIVQHAGGDCFQIRLRYPQDMDYLCATARLDQTHYLLLCTPTDAIFSAKDRIYETLFQEILIFTALYLLVALLVDRLVVRNLDRVNNSLNRITEGDLEEVVSVEESSEFTKLSGDINQTVTSLREHIDAEKRRIQEDLKLAKTIQESALPRVFHFPRKDFEIYALMDPAKQVGGDFYDFFFINANQMALVIADVSGKSVPAALFMMRAKTAIKNYARSGHSPGDLLESANNVLCEGNDAEMFVTVWIGIVDLENGLVRCANAGHEYPLLMRAGEEYAVMKDRHSLPLGSMEGVRMKEYELKLQPGDQILVYTDGVPEAINVQQEAYGVERLAAKANELRKETQQCILEGVLRDVKEFAGAAEQFDDITMVGFTWYGPGKN